jgi:hypothetical protein
VGLFDPSDIAVLTGKPDTGTPEGTEQLYMPGEALFGAVAEDMRALGWAVYPQERDERRMPSMIDRRAIKISKYFDKAPSIRETRRWSLQGASANAAILLGPSSGYTFCLDCDISDEDKARTVRDLAAEILGETPFQRVGTEPKIALFYRTVPEEMPRNRSYFFLADDGESKGGDQIELLSRGKSITAYGQHHKTGAYFRWFGGKPPVIYGPEHAPLVTEEQINVFLDAVHAVLPFHRNAFIGEATATWEYSETDGINVPRLREFPGESGWREDADGFVVDGREHFLWVLSTQAAKTNPGACTTDEGRAKLKKAVFDEFKAKARTDGKWSDSYLTREVEEKVSRACQNIVEGRTKPYDPRKSSGKVPTPAGTRSQQVERVPATPATPAAEPAKPKGKDKDKPSAPPPVADNLDFIPKFGTARERRDDTSTWAYVGPVDPAERERRRLRPDRTETANAVQARLLKALNEVFDEIYDDTPSELRPIHVLKAPTGAGKTTRTIHYIAQDPRTKKYDEAVQRGEKTPGPIVFLLPTYNNISELRLRAEVLNLDGSLSDEDLGAQAMERGLVAEHDLEATLADLRRDAMGAGLRTMIYKGKIAAGCMMADKVQMLMDAGIGTSGLCKARVVKKGEEPEDKYCPHYHVCPAIQQRKQIAESHVVFLPHAFLTLNIPEELKQVRAVIADERIFTLFVHTTTFHMLSLSRQRREPRLTKREREEGKSPTDLLEDRELAAQIAVEALKSGYCPAQALAEYRDKRPKRTVHGLDLVKAAARVCGNAISSDAVITPDMSPAELNEICSKPTGVEVREEFRFWKIIEERIESLIPDLVNGSLDPEGKLRIARKARGDREARIQRIIEEDAKGHLTEMIRISWRSEPNWQEAPLLLLDASASPEITSKLFGSRPVKVHDIPADLNVRTVLVVDKTYSNNAIVAKIGGHKERMGAAKLKDKLQKALSMTSGVFGFGRVVCGGSVAVRRAINTGWTNPSNVDWCHFGAMRGLDFAKRHSAAISFGRMEVPTRTIDGIVAALTYDDEEPEQPFDRNGDGVGLDGGALLLPSSTQAIPLRSGQDAHVLVPMYPGKWARIVQQQYREEELRQFVGRLRPVYREGEAPVWIAVSRVIPDGIVVDELVTLNDLIKRGNKQNYWWAWEALRVTDGVLHPDLAFAAVPFAFSGVDGWTAEVRRLGLDERDGGCGLDRRLTWGFTPVKVRRQDGKETFCFVRSEIRDPSHAVRRAFSEFLEEDVEVVEVGNPVRPREAGQQREEDWVSKDLGDINARKRDEARLLADASIELVKASPPQTFTGIANVQRLPISVNASIDGVAKMPFNIYEMAAMAGTNLMWGRVREGHNSKVSSPVLPVGPSYEHLGDGTYDNDGSS